MDGDRIEQAVQRIEAALARIAAVADNPPAPAADPETEQKLQELGQRHEHLREVANGVLGDLDKLIETIES